MSEAPREAARVNPAGVSDRQRGIKALNQGDNHSAITWFDAAIRATPEDSSVYLYRGLAYFRTRDFDKAIKDFSEAIRLDPKNPTSHVRRGMAYDMKMESDEAIKDYTEAIRLDPNNPKLFVLRAVAYSKVRQNGMAVKDCEEAIRLDPNYSAAYVERGAAHADEREYEKALEDYKHALQLKPNSSVAYYKLAWLRATCPRDQLRNGREALDDAKRACELSDWDDAHNLEALAAAYAENGDFIEAVKWQKKALENQKYGKQEATEAQMRLRRYQEKKPYRELDRSSGPLP
jgi:tetratricopeptide (TPR) repeat protein